MTDTFLELYPDIVQERMLGPVTGLGETRYALRWLDEHPDQLPGRTITESQIAEAFGDEYHYWAKRRLSRIGITVVPDPEPTNFDRLKKFMTEVQNDGMSPDSAAEWLDLHGVKAPGGDDEH